MKRRGFFATILGSLALPGCMREVEIIRIQPEKGDVIILRFKKRVRMEDVSTIRESMAKTFPGCKGFILEEGTDIEIARFG